MNMRGEIKQININFEVEEANTEDISSVAAGETWSTHETCLPGVARSSIVTVAGGGGRFVGVPDGRSAGDIQRWSRARLATQLWTTRSGSVIFISCPRRQLTVIDDIYSKRDRYIRTEDTMSLVYSST